MAKQTTITAEISLTGCNRNLDSRRHIVFYRVFISWTQINRLTYLRRIDTRYTIHDTNEADTHVVTRERLTFHRSVPRRGRPRERQYLVPSILAISSNKYSLTFFSQFARSSQANLPK